MTNSVEHLSTFDYAIIGSGAAGSTLAYQLSFENKIAIIDISNKKNSDAINRSIPPYINKFSSNYTPTTSGVFGGNTELWSGKIYLMTPEEIENWPIKHIELYKYSKLLADELNICHTKIYSQNKIDKNGMYHKSQRNLLGNLFECFNLEFNKNIECFENSTLKKLHLTDNKITKITLEVGEISKEINIKKSLILCCGGLGNIPIYRSCIEYIIPKNKLTNNYKLSDHPHFTIGKIDSKKFTRIHKGYLKKNKNENTEECILVFGKSIKYAFQIDGLKIGSNKFLNISRQSRNRLIRKINSLLNNLQHNILFFVLLIIKGKELKRFRSLEVFTEEPKNSISKIVITNKIWKNNMKKIDIQYQNPQINFDDLKNELYKYTKNNMKNFKRNQLSKNNLYTGLHPSCSTPFKLNPKIGEVTTNLQINGFKNLYILGTNIFPTNGVTNPTWTLMTFAIRLAYFLENKKI